MKCLLVSILLTIFLVGCSGDGSAKPTSINEGSNKERVLSPPEQAALDYFNKMRERDIKYCFFHSIAHHRALEREMKKRGFANLSEKDWRKKAEEIFTTEVKDVFDPVTMLWDDWPESLNGTEVVVLESNVMSAYEMSQRNIVPNGDTVYRVFLHFTFTKIASSPKNKGRLVKKFVLEVPVYYNGKDHFIDNFNWDFVPVGTEFWDGERLS
ncbi:MAG: hypothetical protein Q8O83_00095 [bacterium]|nr:hypothetical protein [bacterium]